MSLFESTLTLLLVAVVLLQVSSRLKVPYPTMLALAGVCVAALPWAPAISMEPRLALALFIAPALLDAAYDLPPRELRRDWVPLIALAFFAVVLTTAAVAWVGWGLAGLPVAAAITLGAIVAPPDAAAASAVLKSFSLPRRTLSILQGESLLNDAVALLIFGASVSAAMSPSASIAGTLPSLLVAPPGGLLVGLVIARLYLRIRPRVAGTLTGTIQEFVTTFGTWLIAERLHLSPILAVVAFAMTIAPRVPATQTPRDRIHSYSVWDSTVFVLNVLAFLLMGLQARIIVARLDGPAFWRALGFAFLVLAIVVIVRLVWVMTTGVLLHRIFPRRAHGSRDPSLPTAREGLIIAWTGMRGLVTLATAFALPAEFPGRDVIVLTAFTVVLGTLVIQGLTIRPLLGWLKIAPDRSLDKEISHGRTAMIDAALASLANKPGDAAAAVRAEYEAAKEVAQDLAKPQADTEHDRLRMRAIAAQRKVLASLRREGRISDDAFHHLEEELDWSELSAAPAGHFQLTDA